MIGGAKLRQNYSSTKRVELSRVKGSHEKVIFFIIFLTNLTSADNIQLLELGL